MRLRGTSVIVAGAGLAGLAAARALEADGAKVAVIDARDRVGGRVWTVRDGFGGQHGEAGADLIESEQTAVLTLARELRLETTRILGGGFAFYGTDRRGRLGIQSAATTFRSVGERLAPLVREYRLGEQRWDGAVAARLGRQSVAEWLTTSHVDNQIKQRVNGFRGLFLADPEDLSLLALVDFFAGVSSAGLGHTTRIKGGNDRLATGMARRLKATPELGTVLRRVRESSDGVSVTLDAPGGLVERRANFLVSALPTTTLRDVAFDPPLPPPHQAAIANLQYGAATRVLLQFSRRFWVHGRKTRLYGTDQPIGAVWDGNEEQRRPRGLLSLLAGGGASPAIQQLLRDEGAAGVVERLRWLGTPATLLASRAITWEDDPWARGGYAYFHPGFDPLWRDVLARPTRHIVFAGEHTSVRWQGYMNGAIESGQRAAAEIAALRVV